MKTYVFQVDIEPEDDGRWSAVVPELPGCNAWGYSKEETLVAIRDNAEMCLEVLIEFGDPMPWEKGHMPDGSTCLESVTVTA